MSHFDLVIIGTGSGNSLPGPEFNHLEIAIIEAGLFGGTCLNAGCIPTKMFVHPADLADAARHGKKLGINAHLDSVDWAGMRQRIFGRIDAIEAGGRAYREGDECPNITVFAGHGSFTGHKEVLVDLHDGTTATITGDRFVLAAGARPIIPELPAFLDAEVPFHTSETIMRLDELPASITILGGGYIAAEFAHVFSSFGVEVTQIVRGDRLLKGQDHEVSELFTEQAAKRYRVIFDAQLEDARDSSAGVELDISTPAEKMTVTSEILLIATGRQANGDTLNVEQTGVTLDSKGRVEVNSYQETAVEGIYALGDISSKFQLKHVANHEARVVRHNLLNPTSRITSDHRFVPAAVFTDPQIATVGLTEEQAIHQGVSYVSKVQKYSDIAAGWAREDDSHFLKVLADPATGLIVGAHAIGPEAATVIQPIIQAMHFGQTATEVAQGQYWIHPALSELVENALLGLPLDPAAVAS